MTQPEANSEPGSANAWSLSAINHAFWCGIPFIYFLKRMGTCHVLPVNTASR